MADVPFDVSKKYGIEARLSDLYADWLVDQRDSHIGHMYSELSLLSKKMINKKFGFHGRINIEDISHDVATSIVVTVVCRRKQIFSWVNLVNKVSYDLTCKWLRTNIYNRVTTVSLDSGYGDNDDDDWCPLDTYPAENYSVFTGLAIEDSIRGALNQIFALMAKCTTNKQLMLTKVAFELYFNNNTKLIELLPMQQQCRVEFLVFQIKEAMKPLMSRVGVADSINFS